MRELLLSGILVVTACGEDGGGGGGGADAAVDTVDAPPGTCGITGTGTGTVTGTVDGREVSPVMRAFQLAVPGQGVGIVLDETAGAACGSPAATGERMILGFCAAPTMRTYAVVGEQAFQCPGMNAFGLMETDGGQDWGESSGGSITIASVTADCVTGTFDVNLIPRNGPGTPVPVTGQFAAVICP
ncbi:MAG: hypothetical protein H0T89_06445 [Deltaproteobacteria bacterium]|nr:hypothetical protein [Deltaproteobacteria bacterium]MDQ3295340.1 hypothetical protein [Myxococcota bacterium]